MSLVSSGSLATCVSWTRLGGTQRASSGTPPISLRQVIRALEESREELQAADQAKDQFLAIVSHELRTPRGDARLGKNASGGVLAEACAARALA
jgi:signal transduction histidine kinase